MVKRQCKKTTFFFPPFVLIIVILGLCCHAGESSRPPFACDPGNAMTKNYPFCRVSLHIRDRVSDLLGRLTLQEKIRLLVNNAAPVERLGMKGFEWWSEALHGVANSPGVHFGGEFPGATSFPQVITTASSFNASLWQQIGRVVSDEARAMYNGGVAGLTFWSPNVNIFRDPRWGRGQETPGEDPTVAAHYAASYVSGLQSPVGNKLKVAACCKHYTAYDLDKWNNVNRFTFNAKVSQQDLEDTYNVPFKACVLEGRVASVMCSYNQVNGKPTCADPNLLRGTIRGQWRLNGYIVSDCDSVDTFFNQQHYTATPEDAVTTTLKAGLDLDCGPFLAIFTERAIRAGKLAEADVNAALRNTLTVQMRLGMFDGPVQPYGHLGPKDVCTPAHQQLALEAARQGIVLLQNRARSLPLSPSRYRTIAVIGPNSDATQTMIGNYAGNPCSYISPLHGIGRYARAIHQTGCNGGVACHDTQQFGAAETAAREADASVLVMGLDQSIEAEAKDRLSLLLPGFQQELVSRVAKASRGPTILVLMSGSPIDVTFVKNDPRISAILWAGYPGQAGGAAIADIIFGTINPGAKLPMTWYPEDYVHKVPMTDMNMRADPRRGYPGRTYRFYKGPVVFPFGYGLSYTNFKVDLAKPLQTTLSVQHLTVKDVPQNTTTTRTRSSNGGEAVRVMHSDCGAMNLGMELDVKNVGEMDGTHTVLVFSTPPPISSHEDGKWGVEKQLVAFEKVHVLAGGQQRIRVEINACKHLSVVDHYGIRRIPMGVHSLQIGDLNHQISLQS